VILEMLAGAFVGVACRGIYDLFRKRSVPVYRSEGSEAEKPKEGPYRTASSLPFTPNVTAPGTAKKKSGPPERCTGYVRAQEILFNDCMSNRSDACRDGRCVFHCRQMCGCEARGAAEASGGSVVPFPGASSGPKGRG
jgi:hypothetical protein